MDKKPDVVPQNVVKNVKPAAQITPPINNIKAGNIWIKGLRIIVLVNFFLVLAVYVIGGVLSLFTGLLNSLIPFSFSIMNVVIFIVGFAVVLIIDFIPTALFMVMLNMAQDISDSKALLKTISLKR